MALSARESFDVVVDRTDGAIVGCHIVGERGVDRTDGAIVGCHIVGERAVELAQVAAVAMAGGRTVERLARVPFSFPTYANALGRAAVVAAAELDGSQMWAVDLRDLYHPDLAGDDLVPAHDNRSMP